MKRRRSDEDVESRLFCGVCKVRLSSESLFETHIAGKKHRENERRREEREQVAKKSVYVRNFSRETTESEIGAAFEKFGEIVKIVVVRSDQGSYAIVEFSRAENAFCVLEQSEAIFVGTKRVTVKPRNVKEKEKAEKEEILRHHGVGEPESKRSRAPRDSQRHSNQSSSFVSQFLTSSLLERLKSVNLIGEEAEILIGELSLSQSGVDERLRLCAEIQSALAHVYPQCVVLPYGSTSNGLGTVGCDLDVTVLLEPLPTVDTVATYRKWIPSSSPSPTRAVHQSSGQGGTADVLDTCAACLSRNVLGIDRLVVIRATKCPLLKFYYRNLDVNCDVSINNRLALENTALLSAYVGMGEWVRRFLFLVRLWAHVRHFSGFHSPGLFSGYALTLMALHYLQQSGHLPCLSQTYDDKETESPRRRIFIDKWDCTFAEPLPLQAQSEPDLGLLLVGFWKYYSSFDFSSRVCAIHTTLISDKATLLAQFHRFPSPSQSPSTDVRPLPLVCVQDPFERDHITTRSVSPNTLRIFRHDCCSAIYILTENEGQFSALLQAPTLKPKIICLSFDRVKKVLAIPEEEEEKSVTLGLLLFYICESLQKELCIRVHSLSAENELNLSDEEDSLSIQRIVSEQEESVRRIGGRQRSCVGAHCSIQSRTWMRRRQVRRGGGGGGTDENRHHTILRFNVFVSEFSPQPDCRRGFDIHFVPICSPVESDFQLCFAFYKKWILGQSGGGGQEPEEGEGEGEEENATLTD